MATATLDTHKVDTASVVDRVVDTARAAAHLTHEARLLKTLAEDAIEDGVHAAKRTVKAVQRRVEGMNDLRDDAAVRVKRQPLRAVGTAFGVGLVLGAAIGWFASRPCSSVHR